MKTAGNERRLSTMLSFITAIFGVQRIESLRGNAALVGFCYENSSPYRLRIGLHYCGAVQVSSISNATSTLDHSIYRTGLRLQDEPVPLSISDTLAKSLKNIKLLTK